MNSMRLSLLLLLSVCLAGCVNTARLQEQAGSHIQIGTAYLGSVQYPSALSEYMAAEKLTPNDPKVHYLLGITYHRMKLSDKAIAEFQRALALKSDDSESHNYLGVIYLEMGRWDDAIASFKRALLNVLNDTPSVSLYNLGRAYYEKRDYDVALKYYQDATEKNPAPVLMSWIERDIGLCWLAKGDAQESVRHFRESLTLNPSFVEPHYLLGLAYQKLRRQAEAVAAFQNAVRLAPESEFGRKAAAALKNPMP
jgi:type IV pilus assembly protein PilF